MNAHRTGIVSLASSKRGILTGIASLVNLTVTASLVSSDGVNPMATVNLVSFASETPTGSLNLAKLEDRTPITGVPVSIHGGTINEATGDLETKRILADNGERIGERMRSRVGALSSVKL